jgi:2,3-bisphosphoglycerate-dependent phosphoglycerate mutase
MAITIGRRCERRIAEQRRQYVQSTPLDDARGAAVATTSSLGQVPSLVLLRHGLSTWNVENRFTGWVDVDLATRGEEEATRAGELLASADGLSLDVVHTSVLTRAVRTANLALDALGRSYLPVHRHWRLNERHYGALQGLDKNEVAERHGPEQFLAWRRGYATPPPPVALTDENHPINDPRYAGIPTSVLPATECLADVVHRMVPYYEDAIAPALLADKSVLIVAHGNSLRALIKYLELISDDDIVELEVPTGVPRIYELDERLTILSARYLADD